MKALAETGNISRATKAANVNRRAHYDWLETDPEYAAAAEAAIEAAGDELEAVAVERAKKGSDVLLIFLLKGAKPEKYRERYEHSGAGGGPIRIVISETDAKL